MHRSNKCSSLRTLVHFCIHVFSNMMNVFYRAHEKKSCTDSVNHYKTPQSQKTTDNIRYLCILDDLGTIKGSSLSSVFVIGMEYLV